MLSVVERRGEVAAAAMAAKAKAEVEARYVIALQRPRSIQQARVDILEACKRPLFAEGARYSKPVGGKNDDGSLKTVPGFSIRFAETAVQAMKNITVDTTTIWEDDEKRTVHISVTDLESNLSYGKEVTIAKTVERKKLKDGQQALAERTNSYGDRVFIVAATEDEISNKIAAAESKIIRNSGLRLIPQDILDEAWQTLNDTMEKGGKDPQAETKRICDSFAGLNVKPAELERYLGHSLETVSPKELADLRAIYSTIKDGEASWASYIDAKKPVATTDDAGDKNKQPDIDPELLKVPIDTVLKWCKRDNVSEDQVLAFMKLKKMTASTNIELPQATDSKLIQVIKTWASILPEIRKIQI